MLKNFESVLDIMIISEIQDFVELKEKPSLYNIVKSNEPNKIIKEKELILKDRIITKSLTKDDENIKRDNAAKKIQKFYRWKRSSIVDSRKDDEIKLYVHIYSTAVNIKSKYVIIDEKQ